MCLAANEKSRFDTVDIAKLVLKEFKSLSWSGSELSVQPVGGATLVHFDTNFFTENSEPQVQTVTLLGQQVQIQATPSSYTWHFGDGADLSTQSPGSAYPDLDVTHQYEIKGTVSPSVDTTYSGQFRVGGGEWQTIPETLTVVGEPQQLEVKSAKPRLVG